MDKLQGYKTYIVAALMAASGFATAVGWISEEQAKALNAILLPLLAAAFRSAMNK